MIQQLNLYLSAKHAETADLRKRPAASKERARLNQMVRDHKERGVSTFHHDCLQIAHVYLMLLFSRTSLTVQPMSTSRILIGMLLCLIAQASILSSHRTPKVCQG